MSKPDGVRGCEGFEWDAGNERKNWEKHGVAKAECEQIYFNQPLIIADDTAHSFAEDRLFALGRTDRQRLLVVVFTIRNNLIRVISARDMSKREREYYRAHG